MTHSEPVTRSPSSLSLTRRTPCVDGCCGPMLMTSSSAPNSVFVFCVVSSTKVLLTFSGSTVRFQCQDFREPRQYPVSECRYLCAADALAILPARESVSNPGGL